MVGDLGVGSRVLVPFSGRVLTAIVVGLAEETSVKGVKEILELMDRTPVLDNHILDLCRWVSSYYFCPLGIILKAALPPGLMKKGSLKAQLVEPGATGGRLGPTARAIVECLIETSPRTPESIGRMTSRPVRDIRRALTDLDARGIVRLERDMGAGRVGVKKRKVVVVKGGLEATAGPTVVSPRQRECLDLLHVSGGRLPLATLQKEFGFSKSVITALETKGLVVLRGEEELRDTSAAAMDVFGEGWGEISPVGGQEAAIERIRESIRRKQMEVFLLHGVSGSGKSVIYIEAIRRIIAAGRSAILMVPEIALTPQIVSRLRSALSLPVALFHSGLSEGERYDVWRRLRSGDYRIAVGARSAVFLPMKDLGLIILDEEHETSYKQDEAPRYHAREVALKRGEMTGSIVLLGSATPSLESYWNATRQGIYTYLEMPHRYLFRRSPRVRIVDMRDAPRWPGSWFISRVLGEKLALRMEKGEQAILFLNRRGHSTFLQCRKCGWVARCTQCDISLTYHRSVRALICHYCFHREGLPAVCPSCEDGRLDLRGLGTEQVEEELGRLFPGARTARMDLDSTATRGSHGRILQQVLKREVDVLLGTQMVTKGLDFPGITLVGVISSDASLHIPDFRAAERTFQLLAQVAGRSGRTGEGGEVVLQTFMPDDRVLKAVQGLDYVTFAEAEIRDRIEASYPPLSRLIDVSMAGRTRDQVIEAVTGGADRIRKSLEALGESGRAALVGPAPCLVERVRGSFRWHFLLKMEPGLDPSPHVMDLMGWMKDRARRGVRLVIDRDPVSFS